MINFEKKNYTRGEVCEFHEFIIVQPEPVLVGVILEVAGEEEFNHVEGVSLRFFEARVFGEKFLKMLGEEG